MRSKRILFHQNRSYSGGVDGRSKFCTPGVGGGFGAFDSIGSISDSIVSIVCYWAVEDRPGHEKWERRVWREVEDAGTGEAQGCWDVKGALGCERC